MNPLLTRFNALSIRERILIILLLALVGLSGLYLAVVRPLVEMRRTALQDIATYSALNARLRVAPPPGTQVRQRSGTPTVIAADAAAELGLTLAANSAEGSAARITLVDMPYELVIRWIGEVERSSPMSVRSARLRRGAGTGLVSGEMEIAP
jgi:type II secretory pathway component PulM